MGSSSKTSDALPPDASAPEALENAVEESRREYDKKVETMEGINDKAMRSVRTAVILVGLVVSAVSVSGPDAIRGLAVFPVLVGVFGVGVLAVSIVYGIGVYATSEYPSGVDSTHREDVITGGYSRDEWAVSMLDDYDEWSEKITEEIATNSSYLGLVQFALSLGVICLLLSGSMILAHTAYEVRPLLTFVVVLGLLFAVRTYLGDKD